MSLLKDSTITKRFFFPREKDIAEPFFINANGNNLSCIRQMRYSYGKMLIVFHADNELVEDYAGRFAHEIDQMGVNLLLVEYPGFSMSSGQSNLVDILYTIPDIIRNCGVSNDRLVVFGRSIGSLYAIDTIAKFPKIKGLIIESGVADFYNRLSKRVYADELDCTEIELQKEVLKYFDTETKLRTYRGSTLIMHAKDDRIIGTDQALKNYEWANEPKAIKIFDYGVHKDLQFSNKTEYFNTIYKFINALD